MKIVQTRRFKKDFYTLSKNIQKRAFKQLKLFFHNPRHPSLQVKKMQGYQGVWEARVTQGYRFTFQIQDDTVIFRRIGTHDTLRNP